VLEDPGAAPRVEAVARAARSEVDIAGAAGAGVTAGPVTYGSLRTVVCPWGPRTMTGAAAALAGNNSPASRTNRLLRTHPMLRSRRGPRHD
jgi:hypothetical protein